MRLVRGGPFVAVKIEFAPPGNPEAADPHERTLGPWQWRATRGGRAVNVFDVWPWCGRYPIDRAEFDYLEALRQHAEVHEPDLPEANPRQAVDLLTTPTPF